MFRNRWALIPLTLTAALLLASCDRRQPGEPTGPTEAAVATVEVTPSAQTITAFGNTVQLTAVAKDAQGGTLSGKTFSWTSSATGVAAVNASGVVTAAGNGTATITATTDGVSGSVSVAVAQQPAQLAIRTQPSGAASGQPFVTQPVIEVQDANGNVVTIDNSTIVTAALTQGSGTLEGTLTATAAAGIAAFTDLEISGTVGDYGLTFSAANLDVATSGVFPVSPGAIAEITLTPTADTLRALGDATQLTATARDVSGNDVPDAVFTWTSSDVSIATVDASGVVTAIGNGLATITVTADNVFAAAALAVAQAVTRVAVTPGTDTLTSIGASRLFSAVAFDANDSTVANAVFLWLSSNHIVAIVDTAGLATATGEGTVTITAAAQGIPGHAVLTVRIPVAAVAVEPDTVGVLVGDTVQLFAIVTDADSTVRTDRAVTWSSSNTLVVTVTPTDSGALLAGIGRGAATITATSEGKSGTSAATVIEVTAEFPVATTAADEFSLAAGFDGTNYLVAIDVDGVEVGAQLVSQSGALVGGFISTGHVGEGDVLSVAFDGTNYLLVWTESGGFVGGRDVYGQFISPAGALVDSAFAITTTQDIDAAGSVAFGGGSYLVSYAKRHAAVPDTGTIHGKFISPAGVVGAELDISSSSIGRIDAALNGVTFDGTNFFVVWSTQEEVRGRFVSPTGGIGTEVLINPTVPADEIAVGVGFDGANYFVGWSDREGADSPSPTVNVYGQLVTPAGVLSGDVIPISTAAGAQILPTFASNGIDFFVTWVDDFGNPANTTLKGRVFDAVGAPVGPEFTLLSPSADGRIPLGFAADFNNGQYLVLILRGAPGTDSFDFEAYTNWDTFGAFIAR